MTGVALTLILAGIVVLAIVAKKLRLPYPVVFVVGGLIVALIPGIPEVTLRPDLVFLLFLPPLIFGDGWTTDARAFWRFRNPILLLALGLVVVTSVAVALLTHAMIGISLALGFVLGGILSPTDAVATDAVAEEVGLPRTLATIVSGESLVNDASGLVIYRFAVAAVMTGAFSFAAALGQFVFSVIGGIAIGVGGAWVIAKASEAIRKAGLSDSLIAVSISLVTPFALYVPADALGASGVLAAMSGGIVMSRLSHRIFDVEARLAAAEVWNLLFFIFNGAAFVLIGLQLRTIVRGFPPHELPGLIGWSLAVAALLVVVRFAWCFLMIYVPPLLSPKLRPLGGPPPSWEGIFVLSYAGMRGIVSLAAALALPETTASGVPFPERPLILFVTFVVILVSLLVEALTLPALIRHLGDALRPDVDAERHVRAAALKTAAEAARAELRTLEAEFAGTREWEIAGRLHSEYEFVTEAVVRVGDGEGGLDAVERRLRIAALNAERRALGELRRAGEIPEDLFRDLTWNIDLTESRWS
ncbi:MAG TPA: Na+/H+ antiporter [Candidatus Elarobacter sp.]